MGAIRITVALVACALLVGAAAAESIVYYDDVTFSGSYVAMGTLPIWDLTLGDLVLSYTLDMSGVTQSSPSATSYTEVGIRHVGAADFNPGPWDTYQGGAGGWLTSQFGDLATDPESQDLDDKHQLSASGARDETDYDCTDPDTIIGPSGTTLNFGIWFDRDGVDPYQEQMWGCVDGGTYNTGGVYDVVITYHAIDAGLGSMFVTINGMPTGFWLGAWYDGQPEFYPAGLSFKGDMTRMQVFEGYVAPAGSGGQVIVSDLTALGHLAHLPFEVELWSGWNLIGGPVCDSQLGCCLVDDGAEVKTWCEAADCGWVQRQTFWYRPYPFPGYRISDTELGDDDCFRPGRGYWVLAYRVCTLCMPQ